MQSSSKQYIILKTKSPHSIEILSFCNLVLFQMNKKFMDFLDLFLGWQGYRGQVVIPSGWESEGQFKPSHSLSVSLII